MQKLVAYVSSAPLLLGTPCVQYSDYTRGKCLKYFLITNDSKVA